MKRPGITGAALALMLAALLSPSALAHGGNPNYRSEFNAIRPAVSGLQVQILNYDDRLLLINRTGKSVLMKGYEGEPYVRLLSDGTVEVNKNSPSFYLNNERYGGTPVPKSASPKAAPSWSVLDKTGRFETHDHRIHWMSKEAKPPQVKDEDKRTKVFDWRVPIVVGSRPAALTGTLYWVPQSGGGIPTAAIVALIVLVLLSLGLFVASRRVRARGDRKPAGA
jgi:hypothetical protein